MDIWIHDDEQLEELLNAKIKTREQLSHWPLSYVEKITLNNNTQIVYKSQRSAASVEKEIYSKMKTFFMPPLIYTGVYENCDIMLMSYLDYPTLGNVSECELERIVLYISGIIQDFSDMPVFFDISSVERLKHIIETVCIGFDAGDDTQNIIALKKWISDNAYECYDNWQIGFVHGDLTAANILVDNGNPRYIIDWQRPMVAPVMLECAMAFRLAGYDAVKKFGEFGLLATICDFIWYAYAYKRFLRYEFIYNQAKKFLSEFTTLLYI